MMDQRTEGAGRSLRISVIIPHLNQPEMLDRCLSSVWSGLRRPDQVFVVDNGSAIQPEAVVAAYPGTVLLQEPTPGPGPARNTGAAVADGDILAFTDADCLADPEWLQAMEANFADPQAQILGGDVRIALTSPPGMTVVEAYESVYAYRMDRYIARQGFTGAGNLAVRREVFADVGPFAGIGVAEDHDWGRRATAQGHRIRFVPNMRVYHPARTSLAELAVKWDRHLAHEYRASRAAARLRLKWLLKTLAMPLSPLAELPQIFTTDRLSGPGQRIRAFAGLVAIRLHRARRMAWLLAGGNPDTLSGRWNRPAAGR